MSRQTATATASDEKASDAKVTAADIEKNLEKLRADLTSLTQAVSSYGAGKASAYKDKAQQSTEDMIAMSENALKALQEEFRSLEKDTRTQIRSHPLKSVAIAAGVGFLAALLVRR